jgi:FHA domain
MEMSWIETSLTRLEMQLRAMIERDPVVDGIPYKFHKQLMGTLSLALQEWVDKKQREGRLEKGNGRAPDKFTLVVQTQQAQILLAHPTELDLLARKLKNLAAQSGLLCTEPPMLQVVPDPNSGEIFAYCEHSTTGIGDTHTVELDELTMVADDSSECRLPKAFLIVNGLSTFPLIQPVINIGSDPSCQLVLDEPGIASWHAQVRFLSGRFIIFDLVSMGTTLVNDLAVSNHVLNAGDVILIAGVPLVYWQEDGTPVGFTQELPAEPLLPEVL